MLSKQNAIMYLTARSCDQITDHILFSRYVSKASIFREQKNNPITKKLQKPNSLMCCANKASFSCSFLIIHILTVTNHSNPAFHPAWLVSACDFKFERVCSS